MAVFRIKIQGTSGSGFGIRIQGLLLYYNQYFMLRKSLDPAPDSGVYWNRIQIFGRKRNRIQ